MPPSMRAQTIANKSRINKRKEEQDRRAKVFSLLQEGQNALQASKKRLCPEQRLQGLKSLQLL